MRSSRRFGRSEAFISAIFSLWRLHSPPQRLQPPEVYVTPKRLLGECNLEGKSCTPSNCWSQGSGAGWQPQRCSLHIQKSGYHKSPTSLNDCKSCAWEQKRMQLCIAQPYSRLLCILKHLCLTVVDKPLPKQEEGPGVVSIEASLHRLQTRKAAVQWVRNPGMVIGYSLRMFLVVGCLRGCTRSVALTTASRSPPSTLSS